MKSEYMYCIKMPTIGLLHRTFGSSETEAISLFCEFEPRVKWQDALSGGYRVVKVVVTELK